MLTLQQMIDQVIADAEGPAREKLAAEAEKSEETTKSKEELERKAKNEEAQQGGGSTDEYSEKTASAYVTALADAVDEVNAYLFKLSSEVGPGKGPGATDTNVDSPVSGEQPEGSGEAKTKIPWKPGMETGDGEKSPPNAMATNYDMSHAPQPEDGVLKQGAAPTWALPAALATLGAGGTVAGTAVGHSRGKKKGRTEGFKKGINIGHHIGVRRGFAAGQQSASSGTSAPKSKSAAIKYNPFEGAGVLDQIRHNPTVQKALLGGAGGVATGTGAAVLGAKALKKRKKDNLDKNAAIKYNPFEGAGVLDQIRHNPAVQKALLGGAGGTAVVGTGGVLGAKALKKRKKDNLNKSAEDRLNPARISAPTTTQLPEDQVSTMKRPAEVTSQERHLQSNSAPVDMGKKDAKAVPKTRMGEVLGEPAQTASTDTVLDNALGASNVDQAKAKIAMMRSYLSKVASEGCTCEKDGLNKGECAWCRLEAKRSGSEKTSMMGAGSAVPSTVQSSSGMGGGGTPGM